MKRRAPRRKPNDLSLADEVRNTFRREFARRREILKRVQEKRDVLNAVIVTMSALRADAGFFALLRSEGLYDAPAVLVASKEDIGDATA